MSCSLTISYKEKSKCSGDLVEPFLAVIGASEINFCVIRYLMMLICEKGLAAPGTENA